MIIIMYLLLHQLLLIVSLLTVILVMENYTIIFMHRARKIFQGVQGIIVLIRRNPIIFLVILLREFNKFEFSKRVGWGSKPPPPHSSLFAHEYQKSYSAINNHYAFMKYHIVNEHFLCIATVSITEFNVCLSIVYLL